ncbi:hypothetical protein, conserved [Leishmania tarentolae]|uniref:FHA domain-containing protein n=1 Tax=Leishmania tarentolae TaxID=5689 RepID=A0A640KE71_LEITA|nr:hypothetical protein, conserved [Leishmania tarentolae]
MYIVELNYGDGEIHRHFLLPGKTYTLGRKACHILLPAAEPSISRHHATIFVASMPRCSVFDPMAQLEIRIEDVSKHGTFVDRERIGNGNSRFLYPEDRIRLGLRVTARIIPVMLVLAISPNLTDASLDLVLDACVHIGALLIEDCVPAPLSYYEQHTNCIGFLYVAEDGFTMEATVMTALGYGYTLVTPNYISNLVHSLEKRSTLMPGEFPSLSSPVPASPRLCSVHYRRPAQTFFSVTEFLSIGRPMMATVFRDCTFVLLERALEETYSEVLRLFGGTVETLALDAVDTWRSRQSSSPLLPLTTVVLVGEADFQGVSDEVVQRSGGGGVFSTAHAHPVMCGYLTMYKYGVCLIPEENVHLALYRNDFKELNTKPRSRYLQRIPEDVLADASLSSVDATPLARRSGTYTGSSSASRQGSTTRVLESPAKAPPSPAAAVDSAPVITRRSREPSSNAGYSPRRAEVGESTMTTALSVIEAPTAAPANASVDKQRCNGSRDASPNPVSSPHSVHGASSASAARETSSNSASAGQSGDGAVSLTMPVGVVPPSANFDGSLHAQDTVASYSRSLVTSVATTALPPAGTGGGGGRNTALQCEGRCIAATSAAVTTVSPSAAPAPQRTRTTTTRRNSHPFSLSARQRNGGEESDDEECTNNGTGAVLGPEEAEGSQGHRHGISSLIRRASGGLRQSSIGNATVLHSWRNDGVACSLSRTASSLQSPGASAAGSGRGHQAPPMFDERLQRRPHAISEERRGNSARGALRRCGSTLDTENSAANSAMPPMALSSSTSPATNGCTGNTTATVMAHQCAGPQKSIPAPATPAVACLAAVEPAPSKRPLTERVNGKAMRKANDTAPPPPEIRRGEQRLAGASSSSPLCGLARLNPSLDPIRSGSHNDRERCTTAEHDVVVYTALQVGVSPPRQRVEAVRIGSASGRLVSVSRDFDAFLSRHIEPADDGVDAVRNQRRVVRSDSLNNGHQHVPHSAARSASARRPPPSFQRCDSSQMRESATPNRLIAPRFSSSVPRSRSAQAHSSVPQSWPQQAAEDGAAHKTSVGNSGEGRSCSTSSRPGSIQRRCGSPTQGNRAPSAATTTSSSVSVAPQVSGLRNDSASSARTPSNNVTVESYLRMNKMLHTHCQSFISQFLDNFVRDTERTVRCVMRQTYMDSTSKQMLEDGVGRVWEFLYYVNSTYAEIPAMYSTTRTRAVCQKVWQKSHYALSKVRSCYKAVNCNEPSVLTRACAALSTRTVAPPHQR